MARVAAVLMLTLACVGCGGGRSVAAPGCTRTSARLPGLHGVERTTVPVPGQPFGVAVDGRDAFVTIGGFSGFPQLGVVDLQRVSATVDLQFNRYRQRLPPSQGAPGAGAPANLVATLGWRRRVVSEQRQTSNQVVCIDLYCSVSFGSAVFEINLA